MSGNDNPCQPMVISALFGFESVLPNSWVEDIFASRLACHPRFRSFLRTTPTGQHFEYLPKCEERGCVPPGVVNFVAPADSSASAAERSASFQQRMNELASAPMRVDGCLWTVHYFPGFSTCNPEKADASTILLRVHHCLGDGVGLVKYCFEFVADKHANAPSARPPPPRREAKPDQASSSFWGNPKATLKYGLHVALNAVDVFIGTFLPDTTTVFTSRALGKEKFMEWGPDLPLEDVKTVAKALGFTVNTVLSACVTTALREYLLRHGDGGMPPKGRKFHAAIAFNMHSLRSSDVSLSNKVLLLSVGLHVAEANPDLRMKLVAESVDDLKSGVKPTLVSFAMNMLMLLPSALTRPLWNRMTRRISVVWTNVPGPREKSAIAGRSIDSIKVSAPVDGDCGLAFTMFSYAGRCSLCVGGDYGRVRHPGVLIDSFVKEFRRLHAKVAG